jgi:hypothetical protein
MDIGMRLYDIQQGRAFKKQKEEFAAIGVDFDAASRRKYTERRVSSFDAALGACETYLALYPSSFDIPSNFEVKADDVNWPEHLRGMKLGNMFNKIKLGKAYRSKRKILEDMGFFQGQGEDIQDFDADGAPKMKRRKLRDSPEQDPYSLAAPLSARAAESHGLGLLGGGGQSSSSSMLGLGSDSGMNSFHNIVYQPPPHGMHGSDGGSGQLELLAHHQHSLFGGLGGLGGMGGLPPLMLGQPGQSGSGASAMSPNMVSSLPISLPIAPCIYIYPHLPSLDSLLRH